ncbi:MAG: glycosyltransferase family 8 protein [Acidimicrobiia bacterium]|nr:glycosyltransferase family 8 protein [Acidimicrobiia bacterium]
MIHVALATDRAYVPYCGVAALSLAEARGDSPLTIHLLHGDDVGQNEVGALTSVASRPGVDVVAHRIDAAAVAELPSVDRFGPVIWFRLLVPELLSDCGRVVYLDADTFAVAPLEDLWSADLGGAAVAAVRNVVHPEHRHRGSALGLPSMSAYFNSGVLLFDLERVRSAGLMAQARDVACRQGDRLLWPDQDALNVAFAGRWLPVHPRWNCMNSLRVWRPWAEETLGADAVAEALADPAVVHFEGPALSKPWHYLSDHPLRERYRSVLDRTPWADTPLADRTVATRFIGRLPERRQRDAFGQLLRMRALRAKRRR